METLLKLLSIRNRFVITHYDMDVYDIVIIQDAQGNALYIQIIDTEF